jgi:hypothetical protein
MTKDEYIRAQFQAQIDVASLELTTTPLGRLLAVVSGTPPLGWTKEQFESAVAARGGVL